MSETGISAFVAADLARLKRLFLDGTGLDASADTTAELAVEVEKYSRFVLLHPELMRLLDCRGSGTPASDKREGNQQSAKATRRYDAVRAVDPKLGTVSKAKAEELCRTGGIESSGRGEYVSGRDVKAVRAPVSESPPPKFWGNFRRSVKPLGWGPGYDGGPSDLSASPVKIGYGFALLGKGQGAVFGVPMPDDIAFVLRDSKSGIFSAGRLPRLRDREEVCAVISRFCKGIRLSRGHNTKPRSGMGEFFHEIADGKPFDPYEFEMRRLVGEFGNLRIGAERLDGGIVYFTGGSRSRLSSDQGTKAVVSAAAAAGIRFAQGSAVPCLGNGAMLVFNPASQALMFGETTILALGMSTGTIR